MKRLLWIVFSTAGSAIGWWLGDKFGMMTAFVLSTIGMIAGVYVGLRMGRDY